MAQLTGKTALITGAARGIGAAIAEAFVRDGAEVLLTDIDGPGAEALAARLGQRAHARTLDVGQPADWSAAADWIEHSWGGLDVLVNNAGITGFGVAEQELHDPEHVTLEDWRAVHRVNTDGVMLGCQWGIKLMKGRAGGSIINLSSRSGVVGIPAAAAYAASKAAVLNHTRTVALYCAQAGYDIRCNAILPAAVLTPMWDDMLGEGEARDRAVADVEAGIPMGRFGRPEEVADAALFLASSASSYMTGTDLHLDGGILAGAASSPRRAED
ncbi:glucose 1-dehydrogenase [Oceanicaulis sp.]|uniref:glucose 1-dehydrogenase n=1 Tax=Oceanicaulis sp. TaxID=1924941 RepID=UPI003BA9E4DA